MKNLKLATWLSILENYGRAVGLILALTFGMLVVGRERLGEAVVAMLYLALIAWITFRWGQWSGICAALMAFLTFNFFFIPPFYTFVIGSLEGVLILTIFLAVAIVVVGRIQASLERAQTSEREAIFMYELSAALAGMRTQEAVAHTLARQLQQLYQASLVRVGVGMTDRSQPITIGEPAKAEIKGQADLILPIWNAWGLIGEIQLWRGYLELPSADSRLLRNYTSQAGQAFERTRLAEAEERIKPFASIIRAN